jgi:hypothetical protein
MINPQLVNVLLEKNENNIIQFLENFTDISEEEIYNVFSFCFSHNLGNVIENYYNNIHRINNANYRNDLVQLARRYGFENYYNEMNVYFLNQNQE